MLIACQRQEVKLSTVTSMPATAAWADAKGACQEPLLSHCSSLGRNCLCIGNLPIYNIYAWTPTTIRLGAYAGFSPILSGPASQGPGLPTCSSFSEYKQRHDHRQRRPSGAGKKSATFLFLIHSIINRISYIRPMKKIITIFIVFVFRQPFAVPAEGRSHHAIVKKRMKNSHCKSWPMNCSMSLSRWLYAQMEQARDWAIAKYNAGHIALVKNGRMRGWRWHLAIDMIYPRVKTLEGTQP